MIQRMFLLLIILSFGEAFVIPTAFVMSSTKACTPKTSSSLLLQGSFIESLTSCTLSDDSLEQAVATTPMDKIMSGIGDSGGMTINNSGGILDTVMTVVTFLVGGAFFLFGLTFLMASVVIPAAARQLEEQCKQLDASLWEEYQAKLNPNETMDMRPDLMQELGTKVQALMNAQFEEQMQQQQQQVAKSITTQADDKEKRFETMDAEIISKETTQPLSSPKDDDEPWNT